jgi:hypothetical protein
MRAGEGSTVPPSKIDWVITPQVGVGPLRLGMAAEEVSAKL